MSLVEELRVGSKVFVEDKNEGWITAEIIELDSNNADSILIRTNQDPAQEYKRPATDLYLCNPPILDAVDDLTTLSFLHEPGVLHNLETRYQMNMIYSFSGPILIAVNPYQRLPLYANEIISAYCGQPLGKLQPHIYAIAEQSYRSMLSDGQNQSILVSGESGAGKTDSTKFLLQYFAAMSSKDATGSIEKKVLESTPVLEAFGNAKTLKNDNSSRFGKFIEVQFNERGNICGANLSTYLLEKSRIVRQAEGERNYHFFYQLCAGASPEERQRFYLEEPGFYEFLNKSGCYEIEGVADDESFRRTRVAFDILGITKEEQENIFAIVSAVLRLGNVTVAPNPNNSDEAIIGDKEHLEIACKLLGVDLATCEKTFTVRKVVAPGETYIKPLSPAQAESAKDSLAMLIYSKLFDWLVSRINKSINNKPESKSFIGVLDIYGFESFEQNSFEQFCINYANEKLQQQFNQHIFKIEQQEYTKEKIDWSYIEFKDNQGCLDLIEKKLGIIDLLDEECTFPRATDDTFVNKLYTHHLKNKQYFEKPKFGTNGFTIMHYAGKVSYNSKGFLDKNKDFIIPEQMSMMQSSTDAFVKKMFSPPPSSGGLLKSVSNLVSGNKSGSSFKLLSVATQFKESLGQLMQTISATNPHYIRCIKPNTSKQAMCFERMMVLHQLRCGGVLETIRICRAGFPSRRQYSSFFNRYKLLMLPTQFPNPTTDTAFKNATETLLKHLNLDERTYQLGLTKVFMKAGIIGLLEDRRTVKMGNAAMAMQKHVRRIYAERAYAIQKKAVLRFQAVFRMCQCLKMGEYLRRERASAKLQTFVRTFNARKLYLEDRKNVVTLQKHIRGHLARVSFRDSLQHIAATNVQKVIRAKAERDRYNALQRIAIWSQTNWRAKVARKELRALKTEAKSLNTIIKQKKEIEEKWEQLEWRYAAEIKLRERLEKQKHTLEDDLSKKNGMVDKLTSTTKQLEEQLQSWKNKYSDKDKDIHSLKDKFHALEDELQAMKRDKDELKKEVKQLNKDSRDQDDLIRSLRERIEDLEDENDELKNSRDSLKEELSEFSKAKQVIEDMKNELEAMHDDRKRLEDENNALNTKLLEAAKQRAVQQETAVQPLTPRSRRGETPELAALRRQLATEVALRHTAEKELALFRSANLDLHNEIAHSIALHQSEEEIIYNAMLPITTSGEVPRNLIDRLLLDYFDSAAVPASTSSGNLMSPNKGSTAASSVPSLEKFINGLPTPGFVMFRFLLLWNALYNAEDAAHKKLLTYLPQVIRAMANNVTEDNHSLVYWLSNLTLLYHLTRNVVGAPRIEVVATPLWEDNKKPKQSQSSKNLKEPHAADKFRDEIQHLLVRIYTVLLENVITKIKPIVLEKLLKRAPAPTSPQLIGKRDASLKDLVIYLRDTHNLFQQHMVCPQLTQQFFSQVLQFIYANVFNEIIMRSDLCNFNKALEIKMDLTLLEERFFAGPHRIASTLPNAELVRQVVSVILMSEKAILNGAETRKTVCPDLTLVQLKQLLSTFNLNSDGNEEETVPVSTLTALVRDPAYDLENSQLLIDTAVVQPLDLAQLYPFDLTEFKVMLFPRTVFERFLVLASPLKSKPDKQAEKAQKAYFKSLLSNSSPLKDKIK
jgi:myosin-5